MTDFEDRPWIYPIYVIVPALPDSPTNPWLVGIRQGLSNFIDELASNPGTGEAIAVAVAEYGTNLRDARPLRSPVGPMILDRPRDLFTISYEAMFRTVQFRTDRDHQAATDAGMMAFRPLVLIALHSAAAATDEWDAAHHQLVLDAEAQLASGDGSVRAVLATMCWHESVEATAAAMAYPATVGRAYRFVDETRAAESVRAILSFASKSLVADFGDQLLPADGDLAGLARVIALPASDVTKHQANHAFVSESVE